MLWSVKHVSVTMISIKLLILNGRNPLSFQHYGPFKETIFLSQTKQKLTWSDVFGRSSTQHLTMSIWTYDGKTENHMLINKLSDYIIFLVVRRKALLAVTEGTENDQRTIVKITATELICCSNAMRESLDVPKLERKTMATMAPKSCMNWD